MVKVIVQIDMNWYKTERLWWSEEEEGSPLGSSQRIDSSILIEIRSRWFLNSVRFGEIWILCFLIINIVFVYKGQFPSTVKGTKGIAKVEPMPTNVRELPSKNLKDWSAYVDNNRRFNHGSKQGRFELKIGIPVNAPVGLWRISIETWYADKWSEKKRFKSKDPVYILFNPFDESDPVHLPHSGGQDEFIFNETGKLYGVMVEVTTMSKVDLGSLDNWGIRSCRQFVIYWITKPLVWKIRKDPIRFGFRGTILKFYFYFPSIKIRNYIFWYITF